MGFFKDVFQPGQLVLILGPMRSGKTNFASFLIEQGVPLGYFFYTNLLFYNVDNEEEIKEAIEEGVLSAKIEYRRIPPEVKTVTTASELIVNLYRTRKNVTILDEALFFAGRARGNAVIVRWFKEFVTQIGKLRSAMVLLAQVGSELAKMLVEKLPTYQIKIRKITWDYRIAEIWYSPPQEGIDAEDPVKLAEWELLPSRYPYDHEAPAMFEFDVNMEEFVKKISKLKSIEARKKAPSIVKEMLEAPLKEKKKKQTLKEKIIDKLKMYPEESAGAIASLCGCSERYVQQIRKNANLFV